MTEVDILARSLSTAELPTDRDRSFPRRSQLPNSGHLRRVRGLVDFVLVPGKAHELAPSLQLLGRPPKAPAWALADIACDAAAFRSATEAMGATPVVPSRKNAKEKKPCPGFVYRHRNQIERCWSRLKEWRAVATRYDKTATSYAARITIASTLDWFKPSR